MKISKKEGPPAPRGQAPSGRPASPIGASRHAAAHFQQRPPQADVARHATAHLRLRFRNIPAGIYENAGTGKVIVIISDAPQRTCSPEYYLGHIRIRNNKYKYASWRQGKKTKEKYLGVI